MSVRSFVATTANAIQFGDRGFFSTSDPNLPSSLLTINPSAFLFSQIAGSIQNNSATPVGTSLVNPTATVLGLRVPNGQSLILLGGDVVVNGSGLIASGGRVELGGVAGKGTVGLIENGRTLQLSFPAEVPRADVSILNNSRIDVFAGGGGDVTIHARNVNVSKGSAIFAGIGAGLGSLSSKAGDINIDATGLVTVSDSSFIGNAVVGIGSSGNINISGQTVNIINGSQTSSISAGQGDAGNVTIRANDTISFSGEDASGNASGITTSVASAAALGFPQFVGNGNGGNIDLQAQTILLQDEALVFTNNLFTQGNAGDILIKVEKMLSLRGGAQIKQALMVKGMLEI